MANNVILVISFGFKLNMQGCRLAIFFVARGRCTKKNIALLFATDCSNWQHHCTLFHPSSNLFRNFTAVLTIAHAHTSRFSLRGGLGTRTSLSKMAAELFGRKSNSSPSITSAMN